VLAPLICLVLGAPDLPELPVRAGREIVLDAKVGEAEWTDAFSITRDHPDGGKVRFRLKRTGPWLAMALTGDGAYRGELLRLYLSDPAGAWVTSLLFGIGQPALPPALWRRSPREALRDPKLGPGECPRACRARIDVMGEERWSAEYLVRLSALGIGRGDLRDLRGIVMLSIAVPEPKTIFVLPTGAANPFDPANYARLVSPDGWGAEERWPPVATDVSREFNDHELLFRLFLEHDKISLREAPEELVIHSAVRPRSMTRIDLLRKELEQGRARNPTLPSWTYFLGRLLHEANLFDAARRVIESVPAHLRGLDAFAGLAAEHYHDTMRFQKALEVCRAYPHTRNALELAKRSLQGRRSLAEEQKALAADAAKKDRNPRVRLVTVKGDIVCELFEDDAPMAVRNFVDLVLRRKFYDQLRFHMVGGGSVAVVGDPRTRPGAVGDRDGPPWRLRVDKSSRPFLRGYMATVPVEGGVFHGSQFVLAVAPVLDPKVAVFGRVVEGLEVLDSVEQDDRLERIEVISKRNHAYDALGTRYEH
jgi:peptidyl-prolyl cis-trans isomerase B (cyclophilin B)